MNLSQLHITLIPMFLSQLVKESYLVNQWKIARGKKEYHIILDLPKSHVIEVQPMYILKLQCICYVICKNNICISLP